jgi:hypothetical protein
MRSTGRPRARSEAAISHPMKPGHPHPHPPTRVAPPHAGDQLPHVLDGAHHVHPRTIAAGNRKPGRLGTGGQQTGDIAQLAPA